MAPWGGIEPPDADGFHAPSGDQPLTIGPDWSVRAPCTLPAPRHSGHISLSIQKVLHLFEVIVCYAEVHSEVFRLRQEPLLLIADHIFGVRKLMQNFSG